MNRLPPPLLWLACWAAQWELSVHLPIAGLHLPAVLWTGRVLLAVGIIVSCSSLGLFARARTTVIPHGRPSAFVVTGPYRFSRNPMYLGGVLLLLGTAAILGAAIAFVFPFLFAAVLTVVHIPPEEKALEARFGEEYVSYKRRVRRWI